MKRLTIFTFIAVFAAVTTGCATDEYGNPLPMTDAEKGAIIGAASGAAIGALASKDNRSKGALIGAVGGGIAGGAVGTYMDSQKKDFEKVLASEIQAGAMAEVCVRSQRPRLERAATSGRSELDVIAVAPTKLAMSGLRAPGLWG